MSSNDIKVWIRFERKLSSGETVKFKIQNVPKGKEADIAEFMAKYYINEEVWSKACGIAANPTAVEEWKGFITFLTGMFPTLLCVVDTGNDGADQPLQIVGCNCFYINKKNGTPFITFETDALKTWFKIVTESEKIGKVYDKYGVDQYLSGMGFSVDPKYRGIGVGEEILKAGRPLCENLGIAVTAAAFSGVEAQHAADKAGYEVVYKANYKTFGEACGVTFNTEVPNITIQAMKI